MMEYRHNAYNIYTGEIINCEKPNYLKRQVAYTGKVNKNYFNTNKGGWRWSHDFGKKWEREGFPTR